MGMRRKAAALLVLGALVLGLLAPALSVRADSSPPQVLDRWWEPRYPIAPERVKLFARVVDPDGIKEVSAIWCYVPPYLCHFPVLNDEGRDGDAVAGDGIYTAYNETDPGVIGASYKLTATDRLDNTVTLEALYALFVDSLDVTLDTEVYAAQPGQAVAVNGSAFFEANATAPAEGVVVTAAAGMSTAQAPVDAAGRFSVELTAAGQDGTYPLSVTATYRTITGEADGTLAISSVPKPDLRIANLKPTSENPAAGEPLSVSFRVQNVGTAQADDVRVAAEVVTAGGTEKVLDQRVSVPPIGGNVLLIASWTPKAGPQTLRITVDPDGEIDELNEANNVAEFPFDARIPGAADASPLPLTLIGAGAAGAAAVALVGLFFMRRRRAREPLETDSGEGKAN